MDINNQSARVRTLVTLGMAVPILLLSGVAFFYKYLEFVHTFRADSAGMFAITPMTNYLLASLGFLCMLLWAAMNGMFHDIEQPKYQMLEQEELLDRRRR